MEVRQIPRIILRGDRERASYRAREGMRQLNILKELMGFQKLKQDARRVQYIDRSEIVCKSIFGEDVVEIYVPEKEKEIKSKKPMVLVGVGSYAHPAVSDPAPSINPYIDYYTYARRVMLFDVEEDKVIESHMTTTELKEKYGIDVWHEDEDTHVMTDRGLRLPDDFTHEKSFPLSRFVNWTTGFHDHVYVYAHGAQAHPIVAWTADVLVRPPTPVLDPAPPCACLGSCIWDQSYWESVNINSQTVDTKGTVDNIINMWKAKIYKKQYNLNLYLASLWKGAGCGCPAGTSCISIDGGGYAYWKCRFSSLGPFIKTVYNYSRFGGSYRLTTRDTYPSMESGCIGYIQTTNQDHQEQGSEFLSSAHGCPMFTYFYIRNIDIDVKCSFGDIYSVNFSHGNYDYWTCAHAGTQGVNGEDLEYPDLQQAFLGVEAGIINNEVICAITGVAGSEKIAFPYIGDWANPGKWDMTAVYKMPKVENVIAGLHVIPLDQEMDYIDMILSANDIDYFSLSTGRAFESAVKELVQKTYEDTVDGHEKNLFSFICIESRIIEKRIEKIDNAERVSYGSPTQPNPWITPKIGKPFWRPL